ncbi:methionyl-tRNA formyltransferase [Peptostreptococcus equinus]|uniref:Methionyl-tRNA formyltransferase n=1 Tax=Peptostreptococcus equinus TaxID=3003601 RepID=A0ABY7JP29_9FIRM|nr:methionyl-tRNA formyltransferase [Peptostreptococcus sp. CBA3647]WAW14234.1 methionyl-tRNA formyltransferase [Peptostreptococcus sp. CBA3647]
MRIVFMGTPDIAVPSLEKLVNSEHEVCAVVTQPDRPKGRGKKLAYSPVKEFAIEKNIEILQPNKTTETGFMKRMKEINPDLIVVIAFGQILKKELLELPKFGCINIHVSLLPKYRGAAPINWAIINGEKKTGVTIMYMDEGLDTGDIISTKEFELDNEINAGQLHDIMMVQGAELLIDTIKDIEAGTNKRIKQDDSLSNYAPLMDKDLGHLDFNKKANDLHNLIRGVVPWPGAWSIYNDQKMKIWKSSVENKNSEQEPGKILSVDKNGIRISCKEGILNISEIQMPNKKRMQVSEYIKGNKIEVGSSLN